MRAINYLIGTCVVLFFSMHTVAQQLRLGDSPYTVEKSAVLDLVSSRQGLLLPRISDTTMINALNPPDGMMIYYTTGTQFLIRKNGKWCELTTPGALTAYWSVNGNANGGTKRFGNTDNFHLSFITNDVERLRIDNTGKVGIGNSLPTEALDVTGNLKWSGALMPNNLAGTAGQILRSNGAGASPSWRNIGLSDLSDASVSSLSAGQLLRYDGSSWTNFTPTYLTAVDTSSITNFYLKTRGLFSGSNGITYDPVTGVISNSGVLSLNGNSGALTMDTTYIANFSGKVRNLFSATGPVTLNSGAIGITQAGAASDGYLSSADWISFQNKQAAGNYLSGLTGDVVASGPGSVAATIANSAVTYQKIQNTSASNVVLGRITPGSGVVEEINTTGSGSVVRSNAPTIVSPVGLVKADVGLSNVDNTSDLAKPISTLTQNALNNKISTTEKAANNGVASLDAVGKIPANQLPVGPQVYLGTWDASLNSPAISDATGQRGDTYRVIADGTVNLGSGNITFSASDDVIHNGTIWQRNPATSDVTSVNGKTGTVILNTDNVSEGLNNLYYTDARANLKISMTEKAANNGVATLDGGGKVPVSQLPFSGMTYRGTWNASTNSPFLINGIGIAGYTYKVAVGGTTTFGFTNISFDVGDEVAYDGLTWQRIPNSTSVSSVNAQTGAVILNTDHITEGATNTYFSNARARAALSATAPLAFNSSTGNFSMLQASSSANGYLSAIDWTTFNQKQAAGNYITSLSGDITAAGPGSSTATIAANAVTFNKMQAINANKLLGSGLTGNSVSEITLGTGLSFSGNTLNAATTGGTVTSFSAGHLSPLFTTSVSNAGTTPALSFSLNSQSANLIFASPNGSSGAPLFRSLAKADLLSTTVYTDQSNTYGSGLKQVFTPSGSTAGLQLAGALSDPTALSNGDVWHNSALHQLRYRANGNTRTIVNTDEAQTITNKTISGLSNTITNISNTALANSTIGLTLGTTGSDVNVGSSPATLGGSLTLNIPSASAVNRGVLSSADWTTFNAKESALTMSTGLTRTANMVTSNLSTGKAGGQTVVGGTAAGEDLKLSSTSHATKGTIQMGNSVYDESTNRLGVGTSTPTNAVHINSTNPLRLEGLQTTTSNNMLVVDDNGVVGKSSSIGLTSLIKASYTIDLPSLGNSSNVSINVAVVGAKVGDNVIVTPSGELTNANGTGLVFIGYSFVSVDGQVTIRFVNSTNATTDVPSKLFYITVIR